MIACAKCSTYNRPAANFCGQCGHPRRGAITQPLSWDAVRARLDRYLALPLGQAPEEVRAVLQPLIAFRQVLWRDEVQVTFIGTFKSGKSTLLNALLSAAILPTRVLRATGHVTRMSFAPVPSARVTVAQPDGTTHTQAIAFDERAQHILLALDDPHPPTAPPAAASEPAGGNRGNTEVLLGIPLSLLEQGCLLVDTPGLMDDYALTARSEQELLRTDLAILVVSAYQLLSSREKEVARNAQRLLHGNIVVVINQMDTIAAADQADVLARATMVLQGIGNDLVGQPRIFPTVAVPEGENGVEEFAHWLTHLLQDAPRAELMLRARLGILSRLLARASEVIASRLREAQETTRQAQAAAAAVYAAQQRRLRRAIREDEVRLDKLTTRLDSLGAAFVASYLQRIEQLMQTDPQWQRKLRACLRQAVRVYTQQVAQGASAALARTCLLVPVFDLYQSDMRGELAAAEAWLGEVGLWAELVPDRQLSIPILSALYAQTIGPLVDDIVTQTRQELQRQTVYSLEYTIRRLLPSMRREALRYLQRVRASLQGINHWPAIDVSAPDTLETARTVEQMYHHLTDWCNEFQAIIASIQQPGTTHRRLHSALG